MLGFPSYVEDEGTYMSQAWSFLSYGRLAPYTYWYDHAPLGWILIASWNLITFGFFTFGISVASGRVLMLVIHLVSTYLLFKITKILTTKTWPAIVSSLVFSLSPLAIIYQRIVL